MTPILAALAVFVVLLILDLLCGAIFKRRLGTIAFPVVAGVVSFIVFSFVG